MSGCPDGTDLGEAKALLAFPTRRAAVVVCAVDWTAATSHGARGMAAAGLVPVVNSNNRYLC